MTDDIEPGSVALRADTQIASPVSEDISVLGIIARAAANPAVDTDKMKALLDMRRDIMKEQAEAAFWQAMSDAQAEMRPIVRDAENKHTRSRYAKIEAIDRAIRPIWTAHGFALSFDTVPNSGDLVHITCHASCHGFTKVYHLDGELDRAGAQGAANKTPIQARQSTRTYLRKELTMLVFNLSLTDDDDDGNDGKPQPRGGSADRMADLETTIAGRAETAGAEPPKTMSANEVRKWADRIPKLMLACKTLDALADLIGTERVHHRVSILRKRGDTDLAERIEAAEQAATTLLKPASDDAALETMVARIGT